MNSWVLLELVGELHRNISEQCFLLSVEILEESRTVEGVVCHDLVSFAAGEGVLQLLVILRLRVVVVVVVDLNHVVNVLDAILLDILLYLVLDRLMSPYEGDAYV